MIENLPVLDSHLHLDPNGDPENSVKRFIDRGGTHLMIIHKPYGHISISNIDDHIRSFETTISMCELANRIGARSWCFIGPYPGELPHIAERIGLEKAEVLQSNALAAALRLVEDGKALGIGEVGRVHFPVLPEVQEVCDRLLTKTFQGAKDNDCPVVLHTESFHSNPGLMEHLSQMIDENRLQRHKVVKHYSGPDLIPRNKNLGISISLQCRKDTLSTLLSTEEDHLLETDFIDDRNRPNVVMPPDTVPKKIKWAYDKGIIDPKRHERLMVNLPKRIFDVDIST